MTLRGWGGPQVSTSSISQVKPGLDVFFLVLSHWEHSRSYQELALYVDRTVKPDPARNLKFQCQQLR